ncbi:hypothetical protein [Paenibacillus sp. 32352]|uniref:hypothetical protein n=1 Tax=Paenibacillus sp. 32352 TaxID=1969111 RepID=UPI0011800CDA|nr:hypothetical protein [Paenibacillus sp. 32352]
MSYSKSQNWLHLLTSFLCRWYSMLFPLFAILITVILFLKLNGHEIKLDDFKNKIEFLSWISAGIMALISFLAIFVAFQYDNKLIEASQIKSEIFYPYELSVEEIRAKLIGYNKLTEKDNIINGLYWVYLLVTTLSIFVWGIASGIYTSFAIYPQHIVTVDGLLNLGIHSFWLSLVILLISICVALNLFRHNYDPINKGYLPNGKVLFNLDYIYKNSGDLRELWGKLSPSFEFYVNPNERRTNLELVAKFSIKMENIKYLLLIKDERHTTMVRIYGEVQSFSRVGTNCILHHEDFRSEYYQLIDENCKSEIKFYSSTGHVVARNKMKVVNDGDIKRVIFERDLEPQQIDLDRGLFSRRVGELSVQYEPLIMNSYSDD